MVGKNKKTEKEEVRVPSALEERTPRCDASWSDDEAERADETSSDTARTEKRSFHGTDKKPNSA